MSTTTVARPKLSMNTTWRKGLTAAAFAAVINTVLYVAGSALGGFPAEVITPMGTPITLVAVILASIAPLLVGTVVYTLLNRWTTNPNRWFTIIAILVLLAFVPGPLTLPNAPMLMIVLLEVMHLVAGGALLYFLTRTRAVPLVQTT
ncbi:hypothetical protein EMGBD1_08010 [Anaerolineaceae bacterium]|nr:hypothetical protein EMGBD1_08010 [Anaerolineaceae bacterium]